MMDAQDMEKIKSLSNFSMQYPEPLKKPLESFSEFVPGAMVDVLVLSSQYCSQALHTTQNSMKL